MCRIYAQENTYNLKEVKKTFKIQAIKTRERKYHIHQNLWQVSSVSLFEHNSEDPFKAKKNT